MLIATDVQDWAGLAVPSPDYWASTAAQYVSKHLFFQSMLGYNHLLTRKLVTILTHQGEPPARPVFGAPINSPSGTGVRT